MYGLADSAGNVTAGTVRTINGMSADAAGNVALSNIAANSISNVIMCNGERIKSFTLPAGGTWQYAWCYDFTATNTIAGGTASGGSTITINTTSSSGVRSFYIAIRIA